MSDILKEHAQFEPVAWWWTRNKIGQDLRERYEVPKELPRELLTLVKKLDEDVGNSRQGVEQVPG